MRNEDDTRPPGKNAGARARGRPRAFDQDAALSQAMRLFWEKGFEATSMSDLTEAMGISSPSLYAAFGSKQALYARTVEHYLERFETLAWASFHAAGSAREAVHAWLNDAAALLTGAAPDFPAGCMVTLSAVGNEGHAELGELVRSLRAAPLHYLAERLTRAVDEGELPATTDVPALARCIKSVQNGMSILARDGASEAELRAVAQVFMRGWDGYAGAR